MRRFQAVLIAAGLAAAPAGAVAGPSRSRSPDPATRIERFEWSTSQGRLGVLVSSMTPELRKHFGAAGDRGVLVERVEPGTPAAAAGVAVGDVITRVETTTIDSATDVLSAMSNMKKGETVEVGLIRDGKSMTVKATLTENVPPPMFQNWSGSPWLRDFIEPFLAPSHPSPFDDDWFRELRHPAKPPGSAKT